MERDPLDDVYSFVERTYVRLQASDLLNRCLDDCTIDPLQQMVEQLILAGPRSLSALREIHAEVKQRITQVQEDIHQFLKDFEQSLGSYGISFGEQHVEKVVHMNRSGFVRFLNHQNIDDKEIRLACLRLLKDCRELVDNLYARLLFLVEIESYLQDWMWGIAVQSIRQEIEKDGPTVATQ